MQSMDFAEGRTIDYSIARSIVRTFFAMPRTCNREDTIVRYRRRGRLFAIY